MDTVTLHTYNENIDDELLPVVWLFKRPSKIINSIQEKIIHERQIERKTYSLEDIFKYLDDHIPSLPSIEQATKQMKIILDQKIPIGIIGDYDVDGICSTALIHTFFKRIGHPSCFFIGDRQDGYGPTNKGFETLRKQGAQAFIVLDSGTVAKEVLEQQTEPIIVLDHHIPDEHHQPNNAIIINPQINNHPMKYCCTGGLVFAFIYHLKSLTNYGGSYETLLAIAGITTVCDVMHLSPLNAMYVQYTVTLIKKNICPTVFQFIITNKLTKKLELFDEEDLGFFIGPHINSIGRLCSNKYIHQLVESISQDEIWEFKKKKFSLISEDDGYNLAPEDSHISKFIDLLSQSFFPEGLTAKDYKSFELIEYMGVLMMNLNVIRKQRQKILQDEIINDPLILNINKQLHIFAFYSQLPQSFLGIVGIVAAKICETYHKPAFIGVILNDKVKGSIRCIEGVNGGLMMIEAKSQNIIVDGGGHAKAGGFTVLLKNWDVFVKFCDDFTRRALQLNQKKKVIYIDYIMSGHGINYNLFKDMSGLKPFGEGNPKLNFLLINCSIGKALTIKKSHLMVTIDLENIGTQKKSSLTGWIFFFDKNKKFLDLLKEINGKDKIVVDLVVHGGCDHNVYIVDYRITERYPKNFLKNYK
jgi:single-stranded-DNA-specific exonuclease